MEYKLSQNRHKAGWRKSTFETLSNYLIQEATELLEATSELTNIINLPAGAAKRDQQRKIDMNTLLEAADVANFAMMIADKVENL